MSTPSATRAELRGSAAERQEPPDAGGAAGGLSLMGLPSAGLSRQSVLMASPVLAAQGYTGSFLFRGTTARPARLHRAGRRTDAVAEGVRATWLALSVGLVRMRRGTVRRIALAAGGRMCCRVLLPWASVSERCR